MKRIGYSAFRASAMLLLGVSALSAALITTAPADGTTTTFQGFFYPNYGQVDPGSLVNSGLTVSANAWAYLSILGFQNSSSWDHLGAVADASGGTVITVDLGGLFSSVGGFMNYSTSAAGSYITDATITALAADHSVLESYDLKTATGGAINATGVDAGAFRGISTGTNDIAYFQISGDYISLHDVTTESAAPEPASAGLMLLALGAGAGLWHRRRKSN